MTMNSKNAISSDGELLLYGEIGSWWDDLDAESVVNQMESLNKDVINVRIHSAGGLILEGLAIYNRLKMSSAKVNVTIDGLAASMASVIAMAGDHVSMPENAWLMIHKPWNQVGGNADDLRKTADDLDKFESSLASIYKAKTGLSDEKIAQMLRDETWISANDALEMGFIDEVIPAVKAAASIDITQFKNPPASALLEATNAAQPVNSKDLEKGEMMTVKNKETAVESKAAVVGEKPQIEALSAENAATQAVAAERLRASQIRHLGAQAKLDQAEVNRMIDEGVSIDNARAQALDLVAARDEAAIPTGRVSVSHDNSSLRNDIAGALLHRYAPGEHKLDEGSSNFAHMSLIDLSRAVIEANGGSTGGLSKASIAAKALSSSDLPGILADVTHKTLRNGYESAPRTFQAFSRRADADDFKAINRSQLGEAPELEKVNEDGEYKYGSLKDGKETYQLETYGKIINISRKTIINDDLDALTRIPFAFGASAAELESNTVYDLLTSNAKMADNKAVFHADHKNMGTAGAISIATLGEARKMLRKQTGLNSSRPMNLQAQFLVVPAALETTAQQFLASISPEAAGSVNPFSGSLTLIVEPRLDVASETAWYMFAAPSRIDTLEYGYLSGEEGVYIETQDNFNSDGIKVKARLDFAAGLIDHRGLFRNVGA